MEILKRFVGIILGSTIAIGWLFFTILGLPLNVIAIMHLWGYKWWGALLLSVFISFIPLLGQLAYAVLAVMGAFYFYQADFNWREATHEIATTTSRFPEQFIADRANFTQSITALGEASDLTQPPSNNSGEAFTIPKAREQRIYSKIEEGLALSKKISDAFLNYIHPDLKYYYRNKLIAGNEIYYERIKANKSGDVLLGAQKQVEGVKLMIEWNNWWRSHNKDLADKAFPTSRR